MKATKADVRSYARKLYIKRREELLEREREELRYFLLEAPLTDDNIRFEMTSLRKLLDALNECLIKLQKLGVWDMDVMPMPDFDKFVEKATKPFYSKYWERELSDYEQYAVESWPKLFEVAKSTEIEITQLIEAYKAVDRIIDKCPNGDKAAKELAKFGFDYYKDTGCENPKGVDLSILKGKSDE